MGSHFKNLTTTKKLEQTESKQKEENYNYNAEINEIENIKQKKVKITKR